MVDRERQPQFLLTRLIVRGGHHKIFTFAKIHYTKWHKTWLTLFTYYSINQERWPPLATTFLGQAVCTNFEEVWRGIQNYKKWDKSEHIQ